ncbi:MAG: asparagine synthase (glutamine-hydrolyzing) [Methylococcus sp.]|nr:asparagine synthase (glutamine-hydrolyzing) [Methylococcus sp.]
MCGFTGFIDRSLPASDRLAETVRRMTGTLRHRGPDDEGLWADPEHGIALGHRRLAIVDLSAAGHQPMLSADGRYVIAFNGEIYNFRELRQRLEAEGATEWLGHSDTEVALAAVHRWGVGKALAAFVGMFALALWDREKKALYLARDRLGEKPLYFGWAGRTFLFGSELKSLRVHPAWTGSIDRGALALYLRHNCVPAPYTIHPGIFKLMPGALLRIEAERADSCPWASGAVPLPPFDAPGCSYRTYWSARDIAEQGLAQPFQGTEREAADELDRLLRQAVRGQMVADVPLGAFLSGGIDSSTVAALMQAQSPRPVKTFTIGFREDGYDEAGHARAVAAHLGTEHTELYVSADEALSVIPKLAEVYDEPFGDSSQIPTLLVAQLARRHVTVALSGDGGDELFGGYNRYIWAPEIWRKAGRIPRPIRSAAANLMRLVPPAAWNRLWSAAALLVPPRLRYAAPGDKLHKLAGALSARQPDDIYLDLVSHWKHPADLVRSAAEPLTALTNPARSPALAGFEQRMLLLDLLSYLPDDILAKIDRAAMSVSLEGRVPLLDHRVVEFAWRLPLSMKIRNGQGKWLLRQVLGRYVPEDLYERPKMGFGIPLDSWLRGPLRDWAEHLIGAERLSRDGLLDPAPIRRAWREHLSGRSNLAYPLWDVLMFQAWLDTQ